MERLIMRALAKSPDDRPQTAEQFRAELLAIERERRAAVATGRRGATGPAAAPPSSSQVPLQLHSRASPVPAGASTTLGVPPQPGPATVALQTRDRRASLIFKVATVVLVLLALGLGAAYLLLGSRGPPVVVAAPARPWDLPAPAARDPKAAARLAAEGDEAVFAGQLAVAQQRFEAAWAADPVPELALKLGEITWQRDQLEEATGWFQRFRRDAPGSLAVEYVDRLPLKTGP
jgi:serine/threonine-protein kinase